MGDYAPMGRDWQDVKYRRGLQSDGLNPDKEQAWDFLFEKLLEYATSDCGRLHVAYAEAGFLTFPDYPPSEDA